MRSRSLTIVVGLALALAITGFAAAATPLPANFDTSALTGNEAEDAVAVNPTDPSNVVVMSTVLRPVRGLSSNVTSDGGSTWSYKTDRSNLKVVFDAHDLVIRVIEEQ